ncbi:MAG: hypothetical protein NT038_10920 [Euryarchaeota archaeon]|nr:hypothetical protein [Euryarchaeota archaeon]
MDGINKKNRSLRYVAVFCVVLISITAFVSAQSIVTTVGSPLYSVRTQGAIDERINVVRTFLNQDTKKIDAQKIINDYLEMYPEDTEFVQGLLASGNIEQILASISEITQNGDVITGIPTVTNITCMMQYTCYTNFCWPDCQPSAQPGPTACQWQTCYWCTPPSTQIEKINNGIMIYNEMNQATNGN